MTEHERIDAEQARWQQAIYERLRSYLGDDGNYLDGSGCDSGDPLDLTLSEINQAFAILDDRHNKTQAKPEPMRYLPSTLRDWHAGLAMQAVVSRTDIKVQDDIDLKVLAKLSYMIADAMQQERVKE